MGGGKARDTFVLVRGSYQNKGEKVKSEPAVGSHYQRITREPPGNEPDG